MSGTLHGLVSRIRRPEYTGENRCLPCTVVNLAISAVIAVAVGRVVAVVRPWPTAVVVGSAVFLLAGLAVAVRGYLVPGTPWFTRRYVPDRLLRRFEKEPVTAPVRSTTDEDTAASTDDGDTAASTDDEDTAASTDDEDTAASTDDDITTVASTLRRLGAVTECEDADDLCLTDDFRTAWREQIVAHREDDSAARDFAALLDVDPEHLSFSSEDDAFVATLDGHRNPSGRWESRAAFIADMAAANVLRERSDAWTDLDFARRTRLLDGLRLFLETCPRCDGPVTVDEAVVESCCRSIDVVAATCRDCGVRVFEVESPD